MLKVEPHEPTLLQYNLQEPSQAVWAMSHLPAGLGHAGN